MFCSTVSAADFEQVNTSFQNSIASMCVCVCVCMCVCIYTLPPAGYFRLQDVCDILEVFGSAIFCCEYF